jgi:molybdopterin-binding protein
MVLMNSRGEIIMRISARNQLKGTVIAIQEGAVNAIVQIKLSGGDIVSATISLAAVKELGLAVGKKASAIIKATSVMVGVED